MTDHRAEAKRLLPESRSEEAAQTHALLAIHDTLAEIRDRLPEPEGVNDERAEWAGRPDSHFNLADDAARAAREHIAQEPDEALWEEWERLCRKAEAEADRRVEEARVGNGELRDALADMTRQRDGWRERYVELSERMDEAAQDFRITAAERDEWKARYKLADDTRVSWSRKNPANGDVRSTWARVAVDSDIGRNPSGYDLRIHPDDVPERPTEDIAYRAHRAAVQHLQNLTEARWAEEDGTDIDWAELGTAGPYDGCDDCIVREIATVVIAELEAAGAIQIPNHDDERVGADDA